MHFCVVIYVVTVLNFNQQIYEFESLDLPLADNFFVLIILAANSSPVDFWTHRLTTEKAPLQKKWLRKFHKKIIACPGWSEQEKEEGKLIWKNMKTFRDSPVILF